MPNPILAAQEITTEWPSWINSQFIIGLLVGVFTLMVLWAILKMTPNAHQQKTGALASALLNYLLLASAIVLIVGGAIFTFAGSTVDQLFNQ